MKHFSANSHFLQFQFLAKAVSNSLENQKCSELHGGSCNIKFLEQFVAGCSSLYKMYLLAHLVPLILFKKQKLIENPKEQAKKLLIGFIKSLLFAGGYSAIVRRIICFVTQYYRFTAYSIFLATIISGVTLNFQPISRQSEIALYCLNKAFETIYNMALRRNLPVRFNYGQLIVMGISTGILCHNYLNNRNCIRSNYLKIFDMLLSES